RGLSPDRLVTAPRTRPFPLTSWARRCRWRILRNCSRRACLWGGLVSFRLKANGPVRTPLGDGTYRVVDLRIGQVIVGSFDGKLTSDGRTAHLELGSAMATGELTGGCTLGLADPYPLSGKVSIKNINLDPFLLTALHLKEFSGHANADGDISLNGALQQPESIIVDANLSRLAM